ncbi:MAG TPA: asparagine synthase (glutamine-hydrolyzing) [Phycisphaerales bacterium]|nr:asparagine synthase (glutamine-hydrolyzing) [Phycisphaerales bacterium]
MLGFATVGGLDTGVSDTLAGRLRDLMTHRGPDGAGLWRAPPAPNGASNVVLAHRRLAVIDTSAAGAQPMTTADRRFALVYNGELYNDAEVRGELTALGERFTTTCDTQTVLLALARWGVAALPRFRGMFALAFYDTRERILLLARDPLGVKPMFYFVAPREGDRPPLVIFASEPRPILEHPRVPCRPDLAVASAYLTTIRTTLGERTLFEGVRTLRPGELLRIDLGSPDGAIRLELSSHWTGPRPGAAPPDAPERLRRALTDSVRAHRRSDVPACTLLSGGLDSAVITTLASAQAGTVRTYASGAEDDPGGDLESASVVAAALGARHAAAPVSARLFADRWPELTGSMGLPLSTPNEVAINHLARRLRADGQVVALSGEGADELLAGYESPMSAALDWEARAGAGSGAGRGDGWRHQLHAGAWMPLELKAAFLNPHVWKALESDAALTSFYRGEFAACVAEAGPGLAAHLRFQRRVNLPGLLQRLDSATMLASVESRTPFADRVMAELVEPWPMTLKFDPARVPAGKVVLRDAFTGRVPDLALTRPKASFPLPFQGWLAPAAPVLGASRLCGEVFAPSALEMVERDPARHWRLAWPMINLALWGRVWWP